MQGKKGYCSTLQLLKRGWFIFLSSVMTKKGPSIQHPNNTTITATKQGQLTLSKHISATGSIVMVLPGIKSSSPVSLDHLCDNGCIIGLNSKGLGGVKNDNIVLEGTRNVEHGLCNIPLHKSTIQPFKHHTPKTHTGIYMTRHALTTNARRVRTLAPNNQPRQLSAFYVTRIPIKILHKLISKQSRQDATWKLHRVNLNNCHHRLSVIV